MELPVLIVGGNPLFQMSSEKNGERFGKQVAQLIIVPAPVNLLGDLRFSLRNCSLSPKSSSVMWFSLCVRVYVLLSYRWINNFLLFRYNLDSQYSFFFSVCSKNGSSSNGSSSSI